MTRFHIILFALCVLGLSHAWAEDSPYKGGMSYTTVGAGQNAPAKNTAQGHLKLRTIEHSALDKEEEEPLASKVWTKYKALAAGTAEEKPVESIPKAVPEAAPAEEKPAPQATGFAAILQKYQQNKAQQSQMNTIEVPRPRAPKKPHIDGLNN